MKPPKDTDKTVILGIDPGYDRCGIGIIQKQKGSKETFLFSDCLLTRKADSFPTRLYQLGKDILNIMDTWKPDVAAIENLFVTKNQKTASRVSEVRGMIVYLIRAKNIPLYEYTPLEIKTTIAGYGKADKKQVEKMVSHSIDIQKKPRYDDEFDALATALTCLYKHINSLSTK